ncbi:MAG: serine/threonine protein kinase [Myxococcales bacterium]|nr:serine/threonine protein kinase [Myxococcales bacterium]
MKSVAGEDDGARAEAREPVAADVSAPAINAAAEPAAEPDQATRTSTRDEEPAQGDSPANHKGEQRTSERLPAPLQFRDPARYDVLGEHGRGGLGRVFRARDREMGRDVALKELLHRGASSELRFFREALITARLEHPGIVPVHEAGRWPDGTPFYAMKLVAGRPLKALIDACTKTDERLALLPHIIAVADAIAYAHDRKIIHRDLKPSNVIVGEFGETVVIDWGLAKDISSEAEPDDAAEDGPYRTSAPAPGVTVVGSVLGTPAYMAPEQAAASGSTSAPTSTRSARCCTSCAPASCRRPTTRTGSTPTCSAATSTST